MIRSREQQFELSNKILFLSQLLLICVVVPINYQTVTPILSRIVLSLLFISGVFTVSLTEGIKLKRWYIPLIIVLPLLWLQLIFPKNPILGTLTTSSNSLLLIIITVNMILKLMKSRRVDGNVLLEAVNGFLLLGIMGAIIFQFISNYFTEPFTGLGINTFSDALYFSYITLTSIGFGDISPAHSVARSAVIFMGIAGQLYSTFLIAFLVGKYLNSAHHHHHR